ncbi:MAG: sulfide/dihydroorotate dehydrogenase-like FAD/NAD-binding protein [Candidatus Bathyarchaeota archaeon]|uniref:sulfide/dihydroorotate dehydrogenase-like FAD/NAD-binding protein n=1 Tax=Candidatus Bathycorpusculum sp. TaxID=2994959 RepID=UPI0028236BBA|nr:sulfide/dihydroorotate dehydrogenase-like FAD/NAD-binding protein [Candidatus Termiticorpusculum sp.]
MVMFEDKTNAPCELFTIVKKEKVSSVINRLVIYAPDIAAKAQAGQFLIIKTRETSERFPLTLSDWNKKDGTITIFFRETGFSTTELGQLCIGEKIQSIAGPLGNPSEIRKYGTVVMACGGLGTAAAYPIARALKEAGNTVITLLGARDKTLFILEKEMSSVSSAVMYSTDDGSKGQKGQITTILQGLIDKKEQIDLVFVIGPSIMMMVTSEVTRPFGIKTISSLNAIMVDGMGMCGACRVTVDGQTKFACVDGPEFDAHKANFKELIQRLKSYASEEKIALHGGNCQCHNHT